MSVQVPERPATALPAFVEEPVQARGFALSLAGLFVVAAIYHWLQSLGHATPAVFTDELMFAELARGIANGDLFVVRGEGFFFPAILPALLQAPAWLIGGVGALGAAKALNSVLMSLAVFPAWWLARQLVRPAYALAVAAATVATGGMLYHSYLTSEAVAYPAFLLAVAAGVRALATPSPRWDAIAVCAFGVAILARAQFVILPLAFFVAVLLVGRPRPLRHHWLALSALGLLAVGAAVRGIGGLGFYQGAGELDYPLAETLRWSGWTAALLPFAAGMLVVPGALLGIGRAVLRPRRRTEAAFGVLTAVLLVGLPLQAGLIASGEAHKPIERYAFYVLPLLFAAFFVYLEHGAPLRRVHAALALALGGLALAFPFASLAIDPFSFDSPTLSAVEELGRRLSVGDAAACFAAAGLVLALAAALVPLRRFGGAVAVASMVLALAVGVAAYAGDRGMTSRTLAALSPPERDWLDKAGVQADVLVLPGGSLHAGWMLESWNRNVGRTYHLGKVDHDPLPHTRVEIKRDGSVSAAGRSIEPGHLVVNESASRAQFAGGERLASTRSGLNLYRTDGPLRLRSYKEGVYLDGWGRGVISYSVWPETALRGRYRVRLELPPGRLARRVEAEAGPVRRTAQLRPGTPLELELPAAGRPIPPLSIRIERADLVDGETPRPRLVAARITVLDFLPKGVQETCETCR